MIRRENGLKQYWILHTLSVALTISIVLHISGCSDTITPKTKDLKLSSSYEISAALDPNNRTLEHTTKVTVKNDGQDSTKELFFHLYGNLYKTETEGIVVSSIIDEKGKVISYELRDNYQLIFLKLNDALKGGGVATIIFACTVTIPEMVSVYGVARDGEIHLPFFNPELAVYDKNGWNDKPLAQAGDGRYLAMSDYMLTIQAPSDYAIVCNGTELSQSSQNGQTTYFFKLDRRRELIIAAFTDHIRLERNVGDIKIIGYFDDSANTTITMDDMGSVMDAATFSIEFIIIFL